VVVDDAVAAHGRGGGDGSGVGERVEVLEFVQVFVAVA